MRYLLDTNVISELLKVQGAEQVAAWVLEHQDCCFLSALTVAELANGVESLPEGKRRNALLRSLAFLQQDLASRMLVDIVHRLRYLCPL